MFGVICAKGLIMYKAHKEYQIKQSSMRVEFDLVFYIVALFTSCSVERNAALKYGTSLFIGDVCIEMRELID